MKIHSAAILVHGSQTNCISESSCATLVDHNIALVYSFLIWDSVTDFMSSLTNTNRKSSGNIIQDPETSFQIKMNELYSSRF